MRLIYPSIAKTARAAKPKYLPRLTSTYCIGTQMECLRGSTLHYDISKSCPLESLFMSTRT